MVNRRQTNERKFSEWESLPEGGRRYLRRVEGIAGYTAIYEKVVDARERTIRFRQLILNSRGHLVEVHEKCPNDSGHRKVEDKS